MFNLSNQEKITIIVLVVVIIIGLGIILYKNTAYKENVVINTSSDNIENNSTVKIDTPPITIHIVGAIKNPGVYKLKQNDRVIDAVKMAGGETEEANLDAINLAAFIKDGQKIIVPYRIYNNPNDEIKGNISKNTEEVYYFNSSSSGKININTANAADLQTLSGIGPVLSNRIIEYRKENGLFGVIDDIKDVPGIGEKKFEGIKDLICVQ